VLKGYAGELTAKQTEMFTRVSRRLDFLESLVNDLLDLAAGKASELAEERPVSLNASIGRVMLLWQPRAEEKNQVMTLDLCRDQLVIRGTEEGLDRILVNLVGNAVKYTPPGGSVTVSVQRVDGQAQVAVSDTGIGIPEESLPHLFEEFYRTPNAKKMAEVGTGLGLAIVKDLVERYGGRIQVQSALGKGTTFTVTFPLLSADTA
jgi:signal transduction histidine kinase